jgi:hypothetical protein
VVGVLSPIYPRWHIEKLRMQNVQGVVIPGGEELGAVATAAVRTEKSVDDDDDDDDDDEEEEEEEEEYFDATQKPDEASGTDTTASQGKAGEVSAPVPVAVAAAAQNDDDGMRTEVRVAPPNQEILAGQGGKKKKGGKKKGGSMMLRHKKFLRNDGSKFKLSQGRSQALCQLAGVTRRSVTLVEEHRRDADAFLAELGRRMRALVDGGRGKTVNEEHAKYALQSMGCTVYMCERG